jgi:hypothetical protein
MHCFELEEKLRRGIIVHYPYVFLGHPGASRTGEELAAHLQTHALSDTAEPCAICRDFRWDGWSRHPSATDAPSAVFTLGDEMRSWICAEVFHVDPGEPLLLTHAQFTRQCVFERADATDERALVLVRNGGQVVPSNHRARVIVNAGDQLVLFKPGGLVRIWRAGVRAGHTDQGDLEVGLEGARQELVLGWDGAWMHALHETMRPSRRKVLAATARTTPDRRVVIEAAPQPAKVTLSPAEMTTLAPGLPPGARKVTVVGVDCVVWSKGGEFVGADLMSKVRKKSGIRVGGATSFDEAVQLLQAEIELTTPAS